MPTIRGVGQSEYSELKEQHYGKILGWHMGVTQRVIGNGWRSDYLLIDATAGTGKLHDYDMIDGSPLVFLRQAQANLTCRWRAVFCEPDKESFPLLAATVGGAPGVTLLQEHYEDVLPRYRQRNQLGLLYVDNNGTPDFPAICGFAQRNPSMEILISVTANGIKRGKKTPLRLSEWIEQIGKKYWAVRRHYTRWQWTFLFGSDTPIFNKEYKKIEMYPAKSEEGRYYLDVMSNTRKEITWKTQPPLTGLMPNT